MCRKSANLSSLEHSMQSAHLRQLTLRESDSLRFVRRYAPSNRVRCHPGGGAKVGGAAAGPQLSNLSSFFSMHSTMWFNYLW